MILPIILSGGSGTRLWPFSRQSLPKQFIPLLGDKTLIQYTIARLAGLDEVMPPIVVGNEEHRFMIKEQLEEIGIDNIKIILESVGRNTAPAISLAALLAQKLYNDPLLLVLPSDHIIEENEAFCQLISNILPNLDKDSLITFGIKPIRIETGYGYINIKRDNSNCPLKIVQKFVEKPDYQTAKKYVQSNEYYWNSGIFLFHASTFLNELKKLSPSIYQHTSQAASHLKQDGCFYRFDEKILENCPSDSIDYAVMEKTSIAKMLPLNIGWSDVGSWNALWELGKRDEVGNITMGDVITHNVENSYIHASDRMVAALGITDHIIIETKDAVLVASKEASQEVKNIVNKLVANKRQESLSHKKVYRPWGWYETLEQSNGFQVKKITVKPRASLSLQLHKFRSEHWIVVEGVAEVTRGEETFTIHKNESVYISVGQKHRLSNPSNNLLELIEVQVGDYLGEDDIIRLEDNYGRI